MQSLMPPLHGVHAYALCITWDTEREINLRNLYNFWGVLKKPKAFWRYCNENDHMAMQLLEMIDLNTLIYGDNQMNSHEAKKMTRKASIVY